MFHFTIFYFVLKTKLQPGVLPVGILLHPAHQIDCFRYMKSKVSCSVDTGMKSPDWVPVLLPVILWDPPVPNIKVKCACLRERDI